MNTGSTVKKTHYNVSCIRYPKCAADCNVAAVAIGNMK